MAIYLKIGSVPGTATDIHYKGWVVLHNFHWGFKVDVKTTVGASGSRLGAGKITPDDISFMKEFDLASVPLMKLAFTGNSTPGIPTTAVLVVTQQATDAGDAYLTYTMSDCMISSFQISASDTGKPIDNFTVNFAKLEIKASPTDETGKAINSIGGYDFTQNKKI